MADSKEFVETMEYIISACSILAKEQYIERYDRVCAQLYSGVGKGIGVNLDNERWCDHVPKPVETTREGRQPYYGIHKCKLSEPSTAIHGRHNSC